MSRLRSAPADPYPGPSPLEWTIVFSLIRQRTSLRNARKLRGEHARQHNIVAFEHIHPIVHDPVNLTIASGNPV